MWLQDQAQIPWSPGAPHATDPSEEHRETTQQSKGAHVQKPKRAIQ